MGKFEKLKTYNILIFALVPLLIIALAATVTLAAMTDRVEGKNIINIAGAGTLTVTVATNNTGAVYPGGTSGIAVEFTYTDDTLPSTSAVTLDADTIEVTGINYSTNGTSYTAVNSSAVASYLTCALSSDVTVQNGQATAATLNITVGPGTGDFSPVDPADRLTYSVTDLRITFTINVNYA